MRKGPTMRLLCLIGPYSGQVLEYPQVIGQNLLDTGYARHPDEEVATPVLETATLPKAETPEAPRRPRRKRTP